MTGAHLEQILVQVQDGSLSVSDALEKVRTLPYTDTGTSLADTHRELRQGFPEVVFARSKTCAETVEAFGALAAVHGYALATHVNTEAAAELSRLFPTGNFDPRSSVFSSGQMADKSDWGKVCVIWAGASDAAVANEAVLTLKFAGVHVETHHDIGVAGLHRLLSKLESIRSARVVIAVAGMEGALPGVVSGLVAAPVIAVPTSVGYGTGANGKAALLSMLNACAGGMGVMNIDNGFGAALLAYRILKAAQPVESAT